MKPAMPTATSPAPVHPASTASATWLDGERFVTGGGSGHAVVLDADRQHNSAPGPVEMVLRSLCACTAADIVMILKKSRQRFTRVEVTADAERAPEPPRVLTRIAMRYRIDGVALDAKAVKRAVTLSHEKYCSVLAMLRTTASVSYEIAPAQAQASRP